MGLVPALPLAGVWNPVCVSVFFAIKPWMTESDSCSGLCPEVVVPEHVDLWKVAEADVPVTGSKRQTSGVAFAL